MGLQNIEEAVNQATMDALSQTNEKLQRLWDGIIDQVNDIYARSLFEKKTRMIKKLDCLLNYYLFDSQKARQVRVEAGLSQTELGNLIFPKLFHHGQARINYFECRGVAPKYRAATTKKYLEWLKERGYNPYKL